MYIKKSKKGQENTSMSKIIVLVIVILVIVVLALFIFRYDIKEWMRNLPGYQSNPEDTEIPISTENLEAVSKICPNLVGRIDGKTLFIEIDGRKTNFYFDRNGFGSKTWENLLYIQYTKTWPDSTVAEAPIYKSIKLIKLVRRTGNTLDDQDLDKLNGAFIYIGRPTEICKI